MESKKTLTSDSGAPVADNQNSSTAGPGGPILLEDHHLIDAIDFRYRIIAQRPPHDLADRFGLRGAFAPRSPTRLVPSSWRRQPVRIRICRTATQVIHS